MTTIDYPGFLNLLPGDGRPCSIHPGHYITGDGCDRCAEINLVRRLRREIQSLIELASCYEDMVCVCRESCGDHLDASAMIHIQNLISDLRLRWDCDNTDPDEPEGGFVQDAPL